MTGNEGIQKFIDDWKDTIKIVDLLSNDMLLIMRLIGQKIEWSKKEGITENDFKAEIQPFLRMMIRSSVTTIEAICFRFKQATINICEQRNIILEQSDLEKLLEKKTDEHGISHNLYLETKKNIKFTFQKIFEVSGASFEIADHEGWKCLQTTIDVRNRLTHPKKSSDLDVSPEEYVDASKGYEWFGNNITELNRLARPDFKSWPPKGQ